MSSITENPQGEKKEEARQSEISILSFCLSKVNFKCFLNAEKNYPYKNVKSFSHEKNSVISMYNF